MLALTRKLGERLRLRVQHPDGGHTDVWLTILDVREHWGGKARLGISAPQTVVIEREEIVRDHDTGGGTR